jgi:hypothetical protein
VGACPSELNFVQPFSVFFRQSSLPVGQPLPFIGRERGRPAMASLGRSCKAKVKPTFYRGKATRTRGPVVA